MKKLTDLKSLQATRQYAPDLAKVTALMHHFLEGPGFTYLNGTGYIFIEKNGSFSVSLDQDEVNSFSLDEVEQAIFTWLSVECPEMFEASPERE